MSITPITFSSSRNIACTTTLDFVELDGDLFLYRLRVISEPGPTSEASTMSPGNMGVSSSTSCGFVRGAGRDSLIAGKMPSKENNLPLRWLSDQDIEAFRTRGFQSVSEEIYDRPRTLNSWDLWKANPDYTVDNLIEVDMGSHMLRDRNGYYLPVAMTFSYIENRLDESSYDLKKVYEHLAARSDVRVLHGNKGDVEPKSFQEALFRIPYYNQEEGRTLSIQFVWTPSKEEYQKVFPGNGKSSGWRVSQVLSSDILGLKQFERSESRDDN